MTFFRAVPIYDKDVKIYLPRNCIKEITQKKHLIDLEQRNFSVENVSCQSELKKGRQIKNKFKMSLSFYLMISFLMLISGERGHA